jgi:hypothetical protein
MKKKFQHILRNEAVREREKALEAVVACKKLINFHEERVKGEE